MLRIGYAPNVSHSLSGPPNGTIKHRIGVIGAVRACAVDLKGYAVVLMPRNGPTSHSYADKNIIAISHANAKLMTYRWLVVSVVHGDKGTCLSKSYWDNFQDTSLCVSSVSTVYGAFTISSTRMLACSSAWVMLMRWSTSMLSCCLATQPC